MDAWERVYKIANELGIKIDLKSWEKEKENALITYLEL